MNFSKYLLSKHSSVEAEAEIQQRFCTLLFDCASNERLGFLPILLDLTNIIVKSNSLLLWQVKFAISLSDKCNSLKPDFVASLRSIIEKKLKSINLQNNMSP